MSVLSQILISLNPTVGVGPVWTSGPNTARGSFSTTAGNGTISAGLIYGGYVGQTNLTDKLSNNVWSATGTMVTGRQYHSGCGSQTSALAFGGIIYPGTSYSNTAEKFNGSNWSSTGNLVTGAQQGYGCGTQTAALRFGGAGSAGNLTTVEKFNGTSWTSFAASMVVVCNGSAGCGTQNDAVAFGGRTTVNLPNTEKWNGTSWSNSVLMLFDRNYAAGIGTATSALATDGFSTLAGGWTVQCESFNGSIWSSNGTKIYAGSRPGVGGSSISAFCVVDNHTEYFQ